MVKNMDEKREGTAGFGEGVIMDAAEAMSIVQLPIIEERFEILRQQIQNGIAEALALECTEETVKEVKKARAALNKQFQQNYENARKEIKTKVLAPYNYFEDLYKKNVSDQFKEADQKLAEKIGQVEGALKEQKREKIVEFFDEYKASIGLSNEPFSWEDVGVSVTLSCTLKSLKESVRQFLDNVKTDIACISSHEYADEIMVEYRKSHSLSEAICAVTQRHEEIEAERERSERSKQEEEAQRLHDAEIDEVLREERKESDPVFHAPAVEKEEVEDDPVEYEVTFRVRGTLEEIIRLKNYLVDNDLTWDQIAE